MKKILIDARRPWINIDFAELAHFRWVFFMLMVRDIKLRYKQTLFGIAWVVLQPLLTAILLTALFGRVMQLPSEGHPYILFAFCGLVPWMIFSQALQRANPSLINDSRLITKVYFPRIFIPLSATFGVVIDLLIALGMLIALLGYFHYSPSLNQFFLPICIALLFIFSSGINLIFSSLSVYYRDFKHIVPFLLQLWMYASPLVYSAKVIPEQFRALYCLNPMVGIIDIFRWACLGQGPFPLYSFWLSMITSALLLVIGTIVFRKIEHHFADII
ncbi:MAG: ABC transporter permease [Verrucomicrobia bacterium]|nr:ABC transporter permease [Verrucomicrobiota bacterium]